MSIFDLLNPQQPDYGPTPDELQAFWGTQDRYAGGAPGATPLQSEGYGGNFGPPPPSWQDRLGTAFASAPQYPVHGFGANFLQGAVRGYGQASVQDQNRRATFSERQMTAQRDANRAALEATQRQRDRELRASMAAQTLAAHGADKRREMLAEAAKAAASTPEAQGEAEARKLAARDSALKKRGLRVPGTPIPKVFTGTPGRVIPSLSALSSRVGREINFASQRGNYAAADSLNAVKATVDDAHAKLREAQSAAEVDAALSNLPDNLDAKVTGELMNARAFRKRQLGNPR